MAVARVQSAGNTTQTGTTITCGIAASAAGNCLIALVSGYTGGGACTVTSVVGNVDSTAWTQAGITNYDPGANESLVAIYYKANCSASNETITATFGQSGYHNLHVIEISGASTTAPFVDDYNGSTGGSGTSCNTGAIDTCADGIIVAIVCGNTAAAFSVGSGYSTIYQFTDVLPALSMYKLTSAGSETPNFTWASSHDFWCCGAAFGAAPFGSSGSTFVPQVIMVL